MSTGSLERILPTGAPIIKLNRDHNFIFTEGPTWDGQGFLYFSDIYANRTYRMAPDGRFTVFRSDTNLANGLCFDHQGNLLACEGGANRVTAVNRAGQVVKVLASTYNGKPLNAPNDIVVDRKGGVYFTDPGFGGLNQDTTAVYYISPQGKLIRVADGITMPNGIALSPDEKVLYVDDTFGKHVWAFDVQPDGTLKNKRQFGELVPAGVKLIAVDGGVLNVLKGYPDATIADGMAVDVEGNLYVTTQLGVQVLSPRGDYLGNIEVPEEPANCCFGGPDQRTLFITARTSVYAIELKIPGVVFPQG